MAEWAEWDEWSSQEESASSSQAQQRSPSPAGKREEAAQQQQTPAAQKGGKVKGKGGQQKRGALRINDVAALNEKLERVALPPAMPWVETLITDSGREIRYGAPGSEKEGTTVAVDVNDDLQRELAFYKQALGCVTTAKKLWKKAAQKDDRIPADWNRPDDYFAEMVKSDVHMDKIRQKLLEEKNRVEGIEKRKRERELRKFGAQKQRAKAQEKRELKKQQIEAVKSYRKKRQQGGAAEVDLKTLLDGDGRDGAGRGNKKHKANPKREYKNMKYGSGGRKRGWKRNDKESYNRDAFNVRDNKKPFANSKGRGGAGKGKRPGKQRRQQKQMKRFQ